MQGAGGRGGHARAEAEDGRERAKQVRTAARERASALRQGEAQNPANGHLRVVDLAVAHSWSHAASAEAVATARAFESSEKVYRLGASVRTRSPRGSRPKKGGVRSYLKDQTRFNAGVRRSRESAEVEAADDMFATRRYQG